MNRIEYMKPSMMVVKIQTANQLLTISDDLGLHNEVSSNSSYAREYICGDDASNTTSKSIWDDEW